MDTVRLGFRLLTRPFDAVHDERFDKGSIWALILCEIPLLAVLVLTGWINPAEGFGRDALSILQYAGSSAIIIGGTLFITAFKCFLTMWAGGVECSMREAIGKLLPILCVLALLEALSTVILFALSYLPGNSVYSLATQVQLFGLELLFAAGAFLWLYERENAGLRRSITVGLACFLLSSAWLLLPLFF